MRHRVGDVLLRFLDGGGLDQRADGGVLVDAGTDLQLGGGGSEFLGELIEDAGLYGEPSILPVYNRRPETFGLDRYLLTTPSQEDATFKGFEIGFTWNTARVLIEGGLTAGISDIPAASRGFHAEENDQGLPGEVWSNPNAQTFSRTRPFADRAYTWGQWERTKAKHGQDAADAEQKAAIKAGKVIIKDSIADITLQQVLTRPTDFDVIATLNLNGDYLSDALAAQVGGIGIAPGGNIN